MRYNRGAKSSWHVYSTRENALILVPGVGLEGKEVGENKQVADSEESKKR
jgi:hypothetical protein